MAEVWLTTTRDNVNYSPVGELREKYAQGKHFESTFVYQVKWNDVYNFCRAVLPDASVGPVFGNPTPGRDTYNVGLYGDPSTFAPRYQLLRLLPEPHPFQAPRDMWADEVEILEGKGVILKRGATNQFDFKDGANNDNYGYARVAVTYRNHPYVVNLANAPANQTPGNELGRYVVRRFKPSSEKIVPKGDITGLAFHEEIVLGSTLTRRVGDNTVIARAMGMSNVSYTWHMVPKVPVSVFQMMGCVNAYSFDDEGIGEILGTAIFNDPPGGAVRGVRPGTMLYIAPEISEPYRTFHGNKCWDITYHMSYRPSGWNNVWRPLINDWRRIFIPFNAAYGHRENVVPSFYTPLEYHRNPSDYADLNNLFILTY